MNLTVMRKKDLFTSLIIKFEHFQAILEPLSAELELSMF